MEGAGGAKFTQAVSHIRYNIRIDTSCDLLTKIHIDQELDDPYSHYPA